jgi:hypothetical protein
MRMMRGSVTSMGKSPGLSGVDVYPGSDRAKLSMIRCGETLQVG